MPKIAQLEADWLAAFGRFNVAAWELGLAEKGRQLLRAMGSPADAVAQEITSLKHLYQSAALAEQDAALAAATRR
jgi:hypothetical protein